MSVMTIRQGRPRTRVAVFACVAVVALVIDQATKAWAQAALGDGRSVRVIPGLLSLTLVHNPGASLGFGSSQTWMISLLAVVACVALVVLALRTISMRWIVALALAFAGALGNLIDRVAYAEGFLNGKVVDERDVRDDDATTHESVFVERANGDVLCLFRNQHHLGRVGKAVSHDGGDTWETVEFDPDLPDIFSQPNAVTVPAGERGCASDRIIFANASLMRPYRGCGVLRLSEDGGRTWKRNRCFNPYHYVYQCMSVLPDGAIGLLWERETAGVYFTRLPLSWFGVEALESK